MSNPVTLSDLKARWRYDFDIPSDPTLQVTLDDAWRFLLSRDRTLEARIADSTVAAEDVVYVVCRIALRTLGNPEGKKQESIDDYAWTRDASLASGEMFVTDDELAMLAPTVAPATRGSVRLVAYGDL